MWRGAGWKQGLVRGKGAQKQGRTLETATLSVEAIKNPSAPEPVLLRQGHGPSRPASDRQAGPTPATAGADDATTRVGAHPHPEP